MSALLVCQALMAVPASAHEHPSPSELDAPAVVYVQTWAQVDISLIEHNNTGQHIPLTKDAYPVLLAQGSGFAVDPTGAIVTSADIVTPDLRRAEIFAVNKIFNQRYGDAVPMPSDPFAVQTIGNVGGDPTNTRLQRCYQPNATNDTGGCVIATTMQVVVHPSVTSQQKFGNLPAEVLSPKPGEASDVAVLRVGASSMPTVELGQSVKGAEAVAALGFTGVPGPKQPMAQLNGHFTKAGSGVLNRTGDDDTKGYYEKLVAGLGQGLHGGPVVAEQGQIVGFFAKPQGEEVPKLVDAEAIRAALKGVGVTARSGPTDTAFENAMHSFKNDEFSGSISSLQETLKLYPGHFNASQNLAVAQAREGTPADKTPEGGGATGAVSGDDGPGWLTFASIGIVVLLALVLGLLMLNQRRQGAKHRTVPPPAPGPVPTASGASVQRPSTSAAPPPAPDKVPTSRTGMGVPPGAAGAAQPRSSQSSLSVMSPPEAVERPSASSAVTSTGHPTFCTSCGQRLSPNHRFCGWCGHHVE
ncbi:MAG: trypsin-like peptidase domain-containing protein [Actinomycetes bacterium]